MRGEVSSSKPWSSGGVAPRRPQKVYSRSSNTSLDKLAILVSPSLARFRYTHMSQALSKRQGV